MKAHKFIVDYEYDFALLGLVTGLKEYTLAWHLNMLWQINFKKMPELEFEFLKNCKIYISNFIFETENSSIRLLKNRSVEFINTQKPYLLPELPKFDYFILLNGEFEKNYHQYLQKIKKLQVIQLAQNVPVYSLPSKDNLLL